MTDIVSKIKDLQLDVDEKQIHSYVSALKDFDSLIANGLTAPRGYSIKTIVHKANVYVINHYIKS